MKYLIYFLCFTSCITFAQIPPGQWECYAFDRSKQSYEGLGDTLKQAMKAAESSCRRKTNQRNCKTAESFCEQGPLSLIEDRCLVTDSNGRSWNATGQDACKTALSLCTEWQFLHGKTSNCTVKHR